MVIGGDVLLRLEAAVAVMILIHGTLTTKGAVLKAPMAAQEMEATEALLAAQEMEATGCVPRAQRARSKLVAATAWPRACLVLTTP